MIQAMLCGSGVYALGQTAYAAGGPGFFASHSLPMGLQLYTLGPLPYRDLQGCFDRLAAIGYRTVELPGLMGKAPTALRAAADRAGLKIASLHLAAAPASRAESLSISSEPGHIADLLGVLGADSAILSMFPFPSGFEVHAGGSFQSALAAAVAAAGADHWKRTADLLNRCGAGLKSRGIALGYHNHNIEFAPIDGTTGFDILARETDPDLLAFEVDIGWVAAAGVDPVRFISRHRGRLRWMHVKDLKGLTRPNFALAMDPTQVGDGVIPWSRVLPAAYRAGVRHFFVEQEPPFAIDRLDAAARSYGFLARLAA